VSPFWLAVTCVNGYPPPSLLFIEGLSGVCEPHIFRAFNRMLILPTTSLSALNPHFSHFRILCPFGLNIPPHIGHREDVLAGSTKTTLIPLSLALYSIIDWSLLKLQRWSLPFTSLEYLTRSLISLEVELEQVVIEHYHVLLEDRPPIGFPPSPPLTIALVNAHCHLARGIEVVAR